VDLSRPLSAQQKQEEPRLYFAPDSPEARRSRTASMRSFRFKCDEPEWRIERPCSQAKRQEPGRPLRLPTTRLREQLLKMLRHTCESFALVYSQKEGCASSCGGAYALQSRDYSSHLHRLARFLSGLLRGRFGEISPTRIRARAPTGCRCSNWSCLLSWSAKRRHHDGCCCGLVPTTA